MITATPMGCTMVATGGSTAVTAWAAASIGIGAARFGGGFHGGGDGHR